MAHIDYSKAREQLSSLFVKLEEKKQNPFVDTPLDGLRDEIKKMRTTYGLSFKQISEHLNELDLNPKLKTNEAEVRKYCSIIIRKRGSRSGTPSQP